MDRFIKEHKFFWGLYAIFFVLSVLFLVFEPKGEAILFCNLHRGTIFNILFRFFSFIIESYTFVILFGLFFLIDYRMSIKIGIVGLLSLLFSVGLKLVCHMPRPVIYFEKLNQLDLLKDIDGYEALSGYTSFPSGHTTAAFGLCLIFALSIRKKWSDILFVILAIFIGLSRVYLSNHFLEDILFGSLLGSFVAILSFVIVDRMKLTAWKIKFF